VNDRKEQDGVRSKIDYTRGWLGLTRNERHERINRQLFVLWTGAAFIVAIDVISGFQLPFPWHVRGAVIGLFILGGFSLGIYQGLWNHFRFERKIRKNRHGPPDHD